MINYFKKLLRRRHCQHLHCNLHTTIIDLVFGYHYNITAKCKNCGKKRLLVKEKYAGPFYSPALSQAKEHCAFLRLEADKKQISLIQL